jgi:hypothetical protein
LNGQRYAFAVNLARLRGRFSVFEAVKRAELLASILQNKTAFAFIGCGRKNSD